MSLRKEMPFNRIKQILYIKTYYIYHLCKLFENDDRSLHSLDPSSFELVVDWLAKLKSEPQFEISVLLREFSGMEEGGAIW